MATIGVLDASLDDVALRFTLVEQIYRQFPMPPRGSRGAKFCSFPRHPAAVALRPFDIVVHTLAKWIDNSDKSVRQRSVATRIDRQ